MTLDDIAARLAPLLAQQAGLRFAFLHGLVLDVANPGDVDVALWLEPAPARHERFDAEATLSIALTRASGLPVDVHIVNDAPIGVLHQVLRGRLLFARGDR